jgi:hypothetical protein
MSPQLGKIDLQNWSKTRFGSSMGYVWHLLYILYSLEVGSFLLFLPWLDIWDNNYFVYLYPRIRPIVANSFLKGGILGLGVINILIGIQESVQFKKRFFKDRSSK